MRFRETRLKWLRDCANTEKPVPEIAIDGLVATWQTTGVITKDVATPPRSIASFQTVLNVRQNRFVSGLARQVFWWLRERSFTRASGRQFWTFGGGAGLRSASGGESVFRVGEIFETAMFGRRGTPTGRLLFGDGGPCAASFRICATSNGRRCCGLSGTA